MEKIVIDGFLYSVKNGTKEKISAIIRECERSTPDKHENGTAFDRYNDALLAISGSQKGIYIDQVYQSF